MPWFVKAGAFLLCLCMLDFFKKIVQYFDANEIPYMLSGSIAMGIYALSQATKDIDFVVYLPAEDIVSFVKHFEGTYSCSETVIRDAINRHSMFTLIDRASGFMANFFILSNEEYQEKGLERRRPIDFFGTNVWVARPEDLLHLSSDAPMLDTPDHVKKIQLEIWLAKPPEERIRLTLQMNDELYSLWNKVKKNMAFSKQDGTDPILYPAGHPENSL